MNAEPANTQLALPLTSRAPEVDPSTWFARCAGLARAMRAQRDVWAPRPFNAEDWEPFVKLCDALGVPVIKGRFGDRDNHPGELTPRGNCWRAFVAPPEEDNTFRGDVREFAYVVKSSGRRTAMTRFDLRIHGVVYLGVGVEQLRDETEVSFRARFDPEFYFPSPFEPEASERTMFVNPVQTARHWSSFCVRAADVELLRVWPPNAQ